MKKHRFHSNCGRLYRIAYILSIAAERQSQYKHSPFPHIIPRFATIKHTYTVTHQAAFAFSDAGRRYIGNKLCYLYRRQQYIPILCRIYGIPLSKPKELLENQACIFSLMRQLIRQKSCTKTSESTINALLDACKEQKQLAFHFSHCEPALPIHRQLMLRDIADEFIFCANTITQILAVILMEQTRYTKKV